MTVFDHDDPRDPLDDKPLWRLEDLLLQCFQADELERILARKYPAIASEMPVASNSPAHFVHAVVALLDRHGLVGTLLFTNLLEWRPLRRAQILSAAAAL